LRAEAHTCGVGEYTGDHLRDARLVGLCPTLVASGGRFTLKAAGKRRAEVSAASFTVDPELVGVFRPRDVFHLVRTATADLGLSLVRGGGLAFAVGAVTVTPLGSEVQVRGGRPPVPGPMPGEDAWVGVQVSGESLQLRTGQSVCIGGYDIYVHRCVECGVPGRHECLAISLSAACPHDAAVRSAKLLAGPSGGLQLINWKWWQF
jgi:hypothetical protein